MACLEVEQKIDLVRRLREESRRNDLRLRTGYTDWNEQTDGRIAQQKKQTKQFFSFKMRLVLAIMIFIIVMTGNVLNISDAEKSIRILQNTISNQMINIDLLELN